MTQVELVRQLQVWRKCLQGQIEALERTVVGKELSSERGYLYALGAWETLLSERIFIDQVIGHLTKNQVSD